MKRPIARGRILSILMAAAGLLPAADLSAQVSLEPAEILALAENPWRSRAAFIDLLDEALQGIELDMPRLSEDLRAADPFLWTIAGRFGAPLPGSRLAGGIVVCARYGLTTRDRLMERDLSDPAIFALFGATLAAHDDAEVWPENGVARLSCMMSWDDPRRVAILTEAGARSALEARFASVVRRGAAAEAPAYRLLGSRGRADTVVSVESARIERGPSHQVIRFRAFLLNGGM